MLHTFVAMFVLSFRLKYIAVKKLTKLVLLNLYCESGSMAQRVERRTCDQQVVGSNFTRGKSGVTTLGKLFTPMCLCHQAV